MIDIKEIRENPERFKKAAKDKHFEVDIDKLLQLDSDLRKAKTRLQEITTEKNAASKSIPKHVPLEFLKASDHRRLRKTL